MRVMRAAVLCALFAVLFMPSIASSLDRDYREGGKEAAYRAGFDNGYRDGLRHGEHDVRFHMRYNYHSWQYDRPDAYYHGYMGHKGQYKKGYKDGYRQGYRDGYRRTGPPRYPRERYW